MNTPAAASLEQRLEFAIQLARRTDAEILPHYQSAQLKVEAKGDQSPVTIADRNAEHFLRKQIEALYPEDGILGEEFPEKPSQNGSRWILDPIDGTKAFIRGIPLFGTLIGWEPGGEQAAETRENALDTYAGVTEKKDRSENTINAPLQKHGQCTLGVCRFPALDEMVYAAQGHGAWYQAHAQDPVPARCSEVNQLSEACFCFTDIQCWQETEKVDLFMRLSKAVKATRGWGDCYGHMLVATGRAEFMIDPMLNPWDAAALQPILAEAGAYFLDWNGQASIHSGQGLAVNSALKESLFSFWGP